MALFYLVRHGQTEWNLAGKMQGRQDSNLTDLGKSQAEAAAEELENETFNYCYYSPMGRTKATAEILLKKHAPVETQPNEDFLEIGFGIWEGSRNCRSGHKEIQSEKEKELHNFWFAPEIYKGAPEDGEDFYQLQERLYNGVEKLKYKHNDSDVILIVSHCAAIRSFLNKCINRDMKDFWEMPKTAPASISIVKWDKGSAPEVLKYSGYDISEVALTK